MQKLKNLKQDFQLLDIDYLILNERKLSIQL